jgi:hypothetical protein
MKKNAFSSPKAQPHLAHSEILLTLSAMQNFMLIGEKV